MKRWQRLHFSLTLLLLLVSACRTQPIATTQYVSLVVDGVERTFEFPSPMTVGDLLEDAAVEVGNLDRVNPPEFTQITDGMRVTVVRVVEQTECERQKLPFSVRNVPNEGLQAGEQRLGQAGQEGEEEVCYRVRLEDGMRREPQEISRTVVVAAQDQVIFVGPTGELEPVPINGTLAYISNQNAWMMRNSSTTKRVVTVLGDLDGRVFTLSPNGQLLFTREVSDPAQLNELWMLPNISADSSPVRLLPTNVLWADWAPQAANTISYSTGEAREAAPGWQAYNDLWIMRLDPSNGEPLSAEQVLERSCNGLYCWWGVRYLWSPDGSQLAWVQADAVGLVDLESTEAAFGEPLLRYAVYSTRGDWSWRATLSWSPESDLLLTTTHGPAVGNEPPETSPRFDVSVTAADGAFSTVLAESAGIWSAPRFSPFVVASGTDAEPFPRGYMAYLQARDPYNSINELAQYDLVVADRDGSNRRIVFPEAGQPGLTARDFGQDFAWGPDGRQIALIYQGNLWVVDVQSNVAHQLTLDGGASKPLWVR